jgi:hypothetical protein
MPVDFQQIQTQIREMGAEAPQRAQTLKNLRERAVLLFEQFAGELDLLRRRVDQAVSLNPALRCALPYDEALDSVHALPSAPDGLVLLAADGSQINPNPHDPVEFAVINVGVFRFCPGCGAAPQEFVQSRLLYHDMLYSSHGLITEEIVALLRDLSERRTLADLAKAETAAVITLTDGPLELFRDPRDEPEYERRFNEYLDVLDNLARLGVTTAGYVDKPQSDLVVRLLELMELPEGQLADAGKVRPFLYVRDIDLFRNRLHPGERTAVYGIQSQSARRFKDHKALRFFYLNVGRADHEWLVRVEIPEWVAAHSEQVDALQAVLIAQCRQMGSKPYPYSLHRAHEVAVVSLDEKTQLQDMMIAELLRRGVTFGETSYKQSGKDLPRRRTR